MVANLEYLMKQMDRLNTESMAGKVTERMNPQTASVYSMDALAGTLTALAKAMEENAGKDTPELKIDLKGVETALKGLAKAMNVKVEPPTVNVEAPTVNVAAPTVNVAAPNVEVLIPEGKRMVVTKVVRDERGLIKTFVSTTVDEYEEEDGMDID